MFLRSTDGLLAGHDGLAVGVMRGHERLSEHALNETARLFFYFRVLVGNEGGGRLLQVVPVLRVIL